MEEGIAFLEEGEGEGMEGVDERRMEVHDYDDIDDEKELDEEGEEPCKR